MGYFGGPGIEGVGQADQADTEHDHRAASDAVGQHAEGPNQQKNKDLGDPGQPAADRTGLVRADDSQMLDENVGLGEVHVRHHPDADQGCVHVGPEVRYAHPGGQIYASDAPTDALFFHGFFPWLPVRHVIAPTEHPGNEGFQPSTRARCPRSQGMLSFPACSLRVGACCKDSQGRLQKGALWTSLDVGKPARQSPAVTGFPVRREESPGSGGRDAR